MIQWLLAKERFPMLVKGHYLIFSVTHVAIIAAVVILAGIAVLWFRTGIMWFRAPK